MKNKIFFLIFLVFTTGLLFPQWKIAGAEGSYLFNVTKIDSTLFLGADQGTYISNGSGINDWIKINSDITQTQRFQKFENKILAIANSGIYESTSQNNYWLKINNGSLPAACLLTRNNIWLVGITCNGVYRSTDFGKNWVPNTLYDDSMSCVSSLLDFDNKIFAVTAKGLQMSIDYGLSWQKIDTTICGGWTYSNALVAIGDTIYAGGTGGLLKSIDRGNTWTSLGLKYVSNILFYNGRLFVISNSGVHFSDDFGATWTKVYEDGYKVGWSFQPMCLEISGENMFLATVVGLYYMPLIEFDSPRLVVYSEDAIDFGKVSVGNLKDTVITIQNRGYEDLIITDITSNSNFIDISPKSFTIRPGDVKPLYIKVNPKSVGEIKTFLQIQSNDLENLKEIPIQVLVTPIDYKLSNNYPNPFNNSTTIDFQISAVEFVRLNLYNVIGEEVLILVDEIKDPGKHSVSLNANDLSSGVYLYRLKVGDFESAKKMILLK